MPVFPQLATGAPALYPLVRRCSLRTVTNEMGEGRRVVYSDPDVNSREWELRLTGITLSEWTAIDNFFATVRGRADAFTFLDPAGNLLARSEEFEDPAWAKGPLVQLTPGQADPLGTIRATHAVNQASSVQAISQTLSVPGTYQYCLSLWARSAGGASITLTASGGNGSSTKSVMLDSQWKRHFLSVGLNQAAGSMTFAIELPPASAVDLFGAQVEAQPGMSDYKRTGAAGGVYAQARFGADELAVRAQGADVFDVSARIVTVGG